MNKFYSFAKGILSYFLPILTKKKKNKKTLPYTKIFVAMKYEQIKYIFYYFLNKKGAIKKKIIRSHMIPVNEIVYVYIKTLETKN